MVIFLKIGSGNRAVLRHSYLVVMLITEVPEIVASQSKFGFKYFPPRMNKCTDECYCPQLTFYCNYICFIDILSDEDNSSNIVFFFFVLGPLLAI